MQQSLSTLLESGLAQPQAASGPVDATFLMAASVRSLTNDLTGLIAETVV